MDSEESSIGTLTSEIVYQAGTAREIWPDLGSKDTGVKVTVRTAPVTANFSLELVIYTSFSRITACWKEAMVVRPDTFGSKAISQFLYQVVVTFEKERDE